MLNLERTWQYIFIGYMRLYTSFTVNVFDFAMGWRVECRRLFLLLIVFTSISSLAELFKTRHTYHHFYRPQA